MNTTVKSTIVALMLAVTLSRIAPVQAQEDVNAVLSKSPVSLQARSVVSRIRPINMRLRPIVQRIRPVLMQSGHSVYLNLPQQAQISKRFIAY